MDILAALLCIVLLVSASMVVFTEKPPLMSKHAWNDLMAIVGLGFVCVMLFGDVVGN